MPTTAATRNRSQPSDSWKSLTEMRNLLDSLSAHVHHRSHLAQGTSWAVAATQAFYEQSSVWLLLCLRLWISKDMNYFSHRNGFHICVCVVRSSISQSQHLALGACPCCPSGPWRRSVGEYTMSCKSCGWLTLTKQVVCKDPAV